MACLTLYNYFNHLQNQNKNWKNTLSTFSEKLNSIQQNFELTVNENLLSLSTYQKDFIKNKFIFYNNQLESIKHSISLHEKEFHRFQKQIENGLRENILQHHKNIQKKILFYKSILEEFVSEIENYPIVQ